MLSDDDDELMSRLQSGEGRALDALMNRWQTPLRHYLYRSVQNEHDALDLAQETFVRVYRNRDKFRAGAKFSTWLFSIALNLCRDRVRRGRIRLTVPLEQAPETEMGSSGTPPDADLVRSETAEKVRSAVHALPEQLREAVLLCEYENLSQADAAVVAGCSAKAVETRLYRARALLRQALSAYFLK